MTSPIPRRAALFALGVIFSANFLSYLDRTLVSALESPIREAFDISASGHGALWTLFTLGYMVFAMPIGMLADRRNRPRILAACVVVWSIATIASGWAKSREVLYVSRFLIGVGDELRAVDVGLELATLEGLSHHEQLGQARQEVFLLLEDPSSPLVLLLEDPRGLLVDHPGRLLGDRKSVV